MTVKKHAIIDGVNVVNVILLDTDDDFTPPNGHLLLVAPDNVAIGWQWASNVWLAPEELSTPSQPVEDPDVIAAKNTAVQELRDIGITEATARRIVGLQVEA